MSTLIRTGISLESDLLERFDRVIHKKGYKNRSEAIRDLVRDYAVAEDVEENRTVVGTLTMVYDHHRPKLSEKLIEAQHHAEDKVLAATHVHLDHHNCLEVYTRRGGQHRHREGNQRRYRVLPFGADERLWGVPHRLPSRWATTPSRRRRPALSAMCRRISALDVDQELTVEITLSVGAQTQTITVSTAPPQVNTSDPVLGVTLEPRRHRRSAHGQPQHLLRGFPHARCDGQQQQLHREPHRHPHFRHWTVHRGCADQRLHRRRQCVGGFLSGWRQQHHRHAQLRQPVARTPTQWRSFAWRPAHSARNTANSLRPWSR